MTMRKEGRRGRKAGGGEERKEGRAMRKMRKEGR